MVPNIDKSRRLLWDKLTGYVSSRDWDMPWCISADFNVTCFPSERSGGSNYNSAMLDFSNFISDQDLLDIPLAGGSFTWLNSREHPSWSRIDRFLVFYDWESHPNLIQK